MWDTDAQIGFTPHASATFSTSPKADKTSSNLNLQSILHKFQPNNSTHIEGTKQRIISKGCPTCKSKDSIFKLGEQFRNKLATWRCEGYQTVPACLQKLALMPFLGTDELNLTVTMINTWVELLPFDAFPLRSTLTEKKMLSRFTGIRFVHTAAKSLHKQIKIVVKPKVKNDYLTKKENGTNDASYDIAKVKVDTNYTYSLPPNSFSTLCSGNKRKYLSQIPTNHAIDDILLIVIFNFPDLVRHIPLLDYTYGRTFKYVVYCGESMSMFDQYYINNTKNVNPVSFLEVNHYRGYWGQSCMAAAMKINYRVKGYLQISDDVILNVWNLYRLPRGVPWFQVRVLFLTILYFV